MVRLPHGRQHGDADCGQVLDAVEPDHAFTVDSRPASDATPAGLTTAGLRSPSAEGGDHALGDTRARQRLLAHYGIAAALDGLVIGTDHAAAAVTGSPTELGHGRVDADPLAGLTKRRVRHVARHLGLPGRDRHQDPDRGPGVPAPQLPGYDEMDDVAEGRSVRPETRAEITHLHAATAHECPGPITPPR